MTEPPPERYADPHCPPAPCEWCTGTAADGTPSWQWCQEMDTCAASIDWEKVYDR